MLNLQACQCIINKHLNEINLPGLPRNLYDPIRYTLELEAKRLRPSLVLMACNLFTDDITGSIHPALAVEVFHNFTLVHDDIMDKSALRRNHSTVHVKWSPDIAILSGDAMVIKAYELLSHKSVRSLEKILPVFNQTALQVCEGQQFDMDYETRQDVTIEEYLKMVEYKTAVLLAAALKIGALCGGADESEADLLYEFGRNIGIAFQLQDDLLDVFADAALFGKVTGNDIVSNKKTILLVEALNSKNEIAKNDLLQWIARKDFNREEKVQAVQQIYLSLHLKELVTQHIQHYHMLAVEQLKTLPLASEKKNELLKFSEYLMNRKK